MSLLASVPFVLHSAKGRFVKEHGTVVSISSSMMLFVDV